MMPQSFQFKVNRIIPHQTAIITNSRLERGHKLDRFITQKADLKVDFLYYGAKGDRTPDLITASDALSQLSYGPIHFFMQKQ
jgi:hypothetical protein